MVVKESEENKILDPHSFNFIFLRVLVSNKVRIVFDRFHDNGVLPKSVLVVFHNVYPKGEEFVLEMLDWLLKSCVSCHNLF